MLKPFRLAVILPIIFGSLLVPVETFSAFAATCNYQQCRSDVGTPTVLVKQGVGRVLDVGDRGIAVATLQRQLNKLLHTRIRVDGIFGQETHRTLIILQSRTGELRTGVVAPQTWAALLAGQYQVSTTDVVRFGDRGPLVKRVQQLLNRHGFVTRVDGVYGNKTLRSVVAFKVAVGLRPHGATSGVVSTRVWNALNLPHSSPAR